MTLLSTVYAAAAINGLFQVSLLVFNRRGNRQANIMLAVLLLLLVQSMWNMFVGSAGWAAAWKTIDFNRWISPFFWGPAIYLYVGVVTGRAKLGPRQVFFHALPGLIFLTSEVLLLFSSHSQGDGWFSGYNDFRRVSSYLLILGYVFASFLMLRDVTRNTHRGRSEKMSLRLTWLKRLVLIFAAILVVDTVVLLPAAFRNAGSAYFDVIMLAEAFAIFAIGYFSLCQTGVAISFHGPEQAEPNRKYADSPVDEQLSKKMMADLIEMIERDRPYLDNDLSLSDLAELSGFSQHHLSQVINQSSGKNFYELINQFRVAHAATMLREDAKASITSVAFEAGFNNRVSFNNAFKKQFGMTPSAYRKAQSGKARTAAE